MRQGEALAQPGGGNEDADSVAVNHRERLGNGLDRLQGVVDRVTAPRPPPSGRVRQVGSLVGDGFHPLADARGASIRQQVHDLHIDARQELGTKSSSRPTG
ncbi:hypothetical protein [Streptomyces sp. NPDC055400]